MTELLEKAKLGDDSAIDELISSYKFLVTVISRKYFLIGGDAEDLIQEGMIGLYKAIRSYSGDKGSFKNYAKVCIENQIISAIRKSSSHKNSILKGAFSLEDETIEGLLPIESMEQTYIEDAVKKERFRKINEKLNDFEKKVLDEYLSGATYLQIATKLNISAKSVDNAISRIKIKLKEKN